MPNSPDNHWITHLIKEFFNSMLISGSIIGFFIAYLYERKEEISSGKKRDHKLINSATCSLLTLPYFYAISGTLDYFKIGYPDSLPIIIGAFLGSLGADKAKALIVNIFDFFMSFISSKKGLSNDNNTISKTEKIHKDDSKPD